MINPKKVEPAPAAKPAASAPDARKGPLTTAEQNAEFKKRQVEKAEADKKAAAAEEQRRVKAENCEIARVHKAQLDSGERISEKDKNGERTFVSDAQRAERQEKARKALEGCN
jgi:tRNA nucleotidyltransferase (CCA-adding enzyme)